MVCGAGSTTLISTGPFNGAGGETLTIQRVEALTSTIDTENDSPSVTVNGVACGSASWTNVQGTTTAATQADVTCTVPAGVGTALDIKLDYGTHSFTLTGAFDYKPPSISSWTAPAIG